MKTLDDLIVVNGMEEKLVKKESKYSKEYLNGLSSPKLRSLCAELGIKVNGDRLDMIADILKK